MPPKRKRDATAVADDGGTTRAYRPPKTRSTKTSTLPYHGKPRAVSPTPESCNLDGQADTSPDKDSAMLNLDSFGASTQASGMVLDAHSGNVHPQDQTKHNLSARSDHALNSTASTDSVAKSSRYKREAVALTEELCTHWDNIQKYIDEGTRCLEEMKQARQGAFTDYDKMRKAAEDAVLNTDALGQELEQMGVKAKALEKLVGGA